MVKLSAKQILIIEETLKKGDRVELIPTKDGVKILKIKRESLHD